MRAAGPDRRAARAVATVGPASGRPAPRSGPGGRLTGPPGHHRRAACVRGRFRLSEVPGVSVAPVLPAGPAATAAAATAAHRALGAAGLGHLGGRLELRTYGGALRGSDLARAARRAVAAALAGPHHRRDDRPDGRRNNRPDDR
ncbi:hypothetical protein ACFRJ1_05450 [Streptomyces sp. NPDC056773]|uniref:hypothetical protein n=1 Tax=unclassified Streptomyces TaxID=2593676 RepID=UPI003689F08B